MFGILFVIIFASCESVFEKSSENTTGNPSDINYILNMNFDNNILDSSENKFAAYWVGTPTFYNSSAIELSNSSANYIRIPHDDKLGSLPEMTITVWASLNSSGVGGVLIAKTNQFKITIFSYGCIGVISTNGTSHGISKALSMDVPVGVNDRAFHKYTLIYNGSVMQFFIDDVLLDSLPVSYPVDNDNTSDLYIGYDPEYLQIFEGTIDSVSITR